MMHSESVESEMIIGGEPQSECVHWAEPHFEADELNETTLQIRSQLIALLQATEQDLIEPLASRWREFVFRMQRQSTRSLSGLVDEAQSFTPERAQVLIQSIRQHRIKFSEWMRDETSAMAQAYDQENASESFQKLFDALSRFHTQWPEPIIVVQEAERFNRLFGDSFRIRCGKALKRIYRRMRKKIGVKSEMMRVVAVDRLVKYHFFGLLPGHLPPIANLIAAQPVAALRSSRRCFDLIDRHYEMIISRLEENSGPELDVDELTGLLRQAISSLEKKFESVIAEQEQFRASVKKELTERFIESYRALLGDVALAGTFELPLRRIRLLKVAAARQRLRAQ